MISHWTFWVNVALLFVALQAGRAIGRGAWLGVMIGMVATFAAFKIAEWGARE